LRLKSTRIEEIPYFSLKLSKKKKRNPGLKIAGNLKEIQTHPRMKKSKAEVFWKFLIIKTGG